MGDSMCLSNSYSDACAAFQRSEQESCQFGTEQSWPDVIDEAGGYGEDARGWTMVCDDGIHPDRSVGIDPAGMGYDLTGRP